MDKLTRRGLFKRVSVGAGATGMLAAAVATGAHFGSTSVANAQTSPAASLQNAGNATTSINASKEPLVVFTNPDKGTLLLMSGEREVTVQNHALVQSLNTLMR